MWLQGAGYGLSGITRDPSIMESVMMGWGEDGVYNPSRVRTTRYMDHVTRTGMVTDHQLSIRAAVNGRTSCFCHLQ